MPADKRDREILRLAIPNILSNLTVPLLGLADTVLMGRMEHAGYLGAIALGGVLFNFIYWGFGFLRMSTVGLTAQAYGRADKQQTSKILYQAVTVSLAGAALVVVLQIPIATIGFDLLKGDQHVKDIASGYFYVRIWAAPATLLLYAIQGWFLGMQNARYPLFLTLLSNLANIGFNIWFVYGFGMKAEGVALGTVCAQYLGLVFAIFLMMYTYREYMTGLLKGISLRGLGQYFMVSRDIFIRTICLLFTFSLFTSESAGKGEIVLAANAILLQMFYIMSYGVDGFAFAAESITGRYVGSKNRSELILYLRRIFIWGMSLGAFFGLTFLLAGPAMINLFTSLENVRNAANDYLWWMVVVSLSGAAAFLWDGIYIGATASVAMRNTMLVATFFVFLPILFFTRELLGNHALWAAMTAFMLFRSVSMGLLLKKEVLSRAL